MTEVIAFPDTLGFLKAYLPPNLTTYGIPRVTVTTDPSPRGDAREVWLQRDGGPALDMVREVVRLRVNTFTDDPALILPLTQRVDALIRACKSGPVVKVDRTSGPVLITPSIKPQTLTQFELIVRGAPLSLS